MEITTIIGSTSLLPGQSTYLYVEFTPSNDGTITDIIEIISNDADEALITVDINGLGIDPPVIEVSPLELNADLFTGETETQVLQIFNFGESDLLIDHLISNFSIPQLVRLDSITKSFRSLERDKHINIRLGTEDLELNDLSDISVGLLVYPGFYDILEADVQSLGAAVTYINLGYTDISEFDIIIDDDNIQSATTTDINLLVDFVNSGGRLILQVDDQSSESNINSILNIVDAHYRSHSYRDFTITSFNEHSTINNITSLESELAGGFFYGSMYEIAQNDQGSTHISTAEMGDGILYMMGNEFMSNTLVGLSSDNRKYALQVIGWLSNINPDWIEINNPFTVIPPDTSYDLEVVFDAVGLNGGVYETNINILSNDPINPEIVVPVTLNVTGSPDIDIETFSLDFGEVFTGVITSDSILISNVGTDELLISSITNSELEITTTIGSTSLLPGLSTLH